MNREPSKKRAFYARLWFSPPKKDKGEFKFAAMT
jgi:hypothetical protein